MKNTLKPEIHPQRGGVVAITTIAVVSIVGVLMLTLIGLRSARSQKLVELEHQTMAQEIGESALRLAEAKIWGGYLASVVESERSTQSLKSYLDHIGIRGGADGGDPVPTEFIESLGVGQDATGAYPFGGGFVGQLEVERHDTADTCEIVIEVVASMGEGTPERRLRRSYDSAGRLKEE